MSDDLTAVQDSEILIYQTEVGRISVEVRLQDETVWLTQELMARLYQTTKQNVSLHIQHIYEEHELAPESTVKKYLTVRKEGARTVKRLLDYYNLDMIISVGYRVKSSVATAFRQWATARLREYIVKGFTLDDERLKGGGGSVDYFDELLARIREIRASEARVYQRIREIFALAGDYREEEQGTQLFFAAMQNKMHFAATGLTAAEIVRQRADSQKANMGLTSWKGSRVLKRDVATAKNYLGTEEIDTLNHITVMFLDQAEFRARRRRDIRMKDWETSLDKFMRDNDLPVLDSSGSISRENALSWAENQYEDFSRRRVLAAEKTAQDRYLDDLRASAKILEAHLVEKSVSKNTNKSRSKKGKA